MVIYILRLRLTDCSDIMHKSLDHEKESGKQNSGYTRNKLLYSLSTKLVLGWQPF
jgi:hypothetical protein